MRILLFLLFYTPALFAGPYIEIKSEVTYKDWAISDQTNHTRFGYEKKNVLGNVYAAFSVAQGFGTFSTVVEDSPATTSQITYTIQGEHQHASGTLYINSRNDGLNDCDRLGNITIMEIAG